jgi:hypothetical protein
VDDWLIELEKPGTIEYDARPVGIHAKVQIVKEEQFSLGINSCRQLHYCNGIMPVSHESVLRGVVPRNRWKGIARIADVIEVLLSA